MHMWGDGFPYFEDVGEAAHEIGMLCREAGISVTCWKEKYGTARVYCDLDEEQIPAYRAAYEQVLKKYPHIHDEIINGADWDEYLEGL